MDGGPEMSDRPEGAPDQAPAAVSHSEKRFEILATVMLAVAALATAWSGYQASLWDGIQSSNYTQRPQPAPTRHRSTPRPTSTDWGT
jgi:type VI protein secretion system component VasF